MSEQLLINVSEYETRVALLNNDRLEALYLERGASSSLVGNIYLGSVVRIMPGIQAAFIKIGGSDDSGIDRPGFLHVSDIPGGDDIRSLLHEGQSVFVQVSKDQIANKGARLTMYLSIAARYLVLMLNSSHIGISQKIIDPDERARLQAMVESARDELDISDSHGFIVRTLAESADQGQLLEDVRYLKKLWQSLDGGSVGAPRLIYEDLPKHIRVIRDLAFDELAAIKIDDADTYYRAHQFLGHYLAEHSDLLELWRDESAIFDVANIEQDILSVMNSKVSLKSGSTIIIEQTEAMVTIDVNTGAYMGNKTLEETIYKVNLEAAEEIPRQLRLRNLGGIIVIDFIDMVVEAHRSEILEVLEKGLQRDPARTRVFGFSGLGLVEMSRKRDRDSLARQMGEACVSCAGQAYVKSARSVCYEIFRVLEQSAGRGQIVVKTAAGNELPAPAFPRRLYRLHAHQEIIDALNEHESRQFARQCELLYIEVELQAQAEYSRERFNLIRI
ncbi:MAG: Rne/Rng family ribonuclease [Pseudomonadales bacterium]|nr:Rne/Rng family ribonuclease [Pseudomonadales bacterium]